MAKDPQTGATVDQVDSLLNAFRSGKTTAPNAGLTPPPDFSIPDNSAAAPKDNNALLEKYATQYGVDLPIARAMMRQESGGKSNAVSPKGALGPTQLMPGTAKMLGVDPNDPEQNIEGGMRHLSNLLRRYDNQYALALAAYHAGSGNVDKANGIPDTHDGLIATRDYVKNILARAQQGQGAQPPATATAGPSVDDVDSLLGQFRADQQKQEANSPIGINRRVREYAQSQLPTLKTQLAAVEKQIADSGNQQLAAIDPLNAPAETQNLQVEQQQLREAIEFYRQAQMLDPAQAGVKNSLKQAISDSRAIPFVGSAIKDINRENVLQVAEKYGRGEALSPSENALLDAYTTFSTAQQTYKPTTAETVTDFGLGATQFMAEFALTGGARAAQREAMQYGTEQAMRKVFGKYAEKWLEKNAAGKYVAKNLIAKGAQNTLRVGSKVAAAPLQGAVLPMSVEKTVESATPRLTYHPDAEGQLVKAVDKKGDDVVTALERGYGHAAVMAFLARSGHGVDAMLDKVKSRMLARWMAEKGIQNIDKASEIASKIGWDGIVGQTAELQGIKLGGNLVDMAAGDKDATPGRGFSKEELMTELLGNVLLGVGGKALGYGAGTAGRAVDEYSAKQRAVKFDALAEQQFEKKYRDLNDFDRARVLVAYADTPEAAADRDLLQKEAAYLAKKHSEVVTEKNAEGDKVSYRRPLGQLEMDAARQRFSDIGLARSEGRAAGPVVPTWTLDENNQVVPRDFALMHPDPGAGPYARAEEFAQNADSMPQGIAAAQAKLLAQFQSGELKVPTNAAEWEQVRQQLAQNAAGVTADATIAGRAERSATAYPEATELGFTPPPPFEAPLVGEPMTRQEREVARLEQQLAEARRVIEHERSLQAEQEAERTPQPAAPEFRDREAFQRQLNGEFDLLDIVATVRRPRGLVHDRRRVRPDEPQAAEAPPTENGAELPRPVRVEELPGVRITDRRALPFGDGLRQLDERTVGTIEKELARYREQNYYGDLAELATSLRQQKAGGKPLTPEQREVLGMLAQREAAMVRLGEWQRQEAARKAHAAEVLRGLGIQTGEPAAPPAAATPTLTPPPAVEARPVPAQPSAVEKPVEVAVASTPQQRVQDLTAAFYEARRQGDGKRADELMDEMLRQKRAEATSSASIPPASGSAEPTAKTEAAQRTPTGGTKPKVTEARRQELADKLRRYFENPNDVLFQSDHSAPDLPIPAFEAALELGLYHYERGVRDYAKWSAALTEDVGDGIKPYLKDLHRGLERQHYTDFAEKKADEAPAPPEVRRAIARREGKVRDAADTLKKAAEHAKSPDENLALQAQAEEAKQIAEQLRRTRMEEERRARQQQEKEADQPLSEPLSMVKGKDAILVIPGKSERIPAFYAVVNLKDTRPSHDPYTWKQNDNAFQPRDSYGTDIAVQQKVLDRGRNPEFFRIINTNPDATNGPSIIRADGLVAGGNQRDLIERILYNEGYGEKYREYLVEHATEFGLDPDAIPPVTNTFWPVLKRVMKDSPTNRAEMFKIGDDLNLDPTGGYSTSERAAATAKRLPDSVIEWAAHEMAENSGIDPATGKEKLWSVRDLMRNRGEHIKALLDEWVIPLDKRSEYIQKLSDGTEKLTEKALLAFEDALLARTGLDTRILAELEEAAPSIKNKLTQSAAALVRIAAREDEWNIIRYVNDAAGLQARAQSVREAFNDWKAMVREHNRDVERRSKQGDKGVSGEVPLTDSLVEWYLHPEKYKLTTDDMFAAAGEDPATREAPDAIHPITEALARELDDKGVEVRKALAAYAEAAEQSGDENQGSLIPIPRQTADESFNQHLGRPNGIEVRPEEWGQAVAPRPIETKPIETPHPGTHTAEGVARDNDYFAQAKAELGPEATVSQIAQRAQELKDGKGKGFAPPPEVVPVPKPEKPGQGGGAAAAAVPEPEIEQIEPPPALTGAGSGTRALSNEEVARAARGEKYFTISKGGNLTAHGAQPDGASDLKGGAVVKVLPDGRYEVQRGDARVAEKYKARVLAAVKPATAKVSPPPKVESETRTEVTPPPSVEAAPKVAAPATADPRTLSDEQLAAERAQISETTKPLYAALDKMRDGGARYSGKQFVGYTPDAQEINAKIKPLQRRDEMLNLELKRREQEATNKRTADARDKRIAAAPVYQRRNGWEIVQDRAEYVLRDPNTKEEVYSGRLARVREIADESKPQVAAPPPAVESETKTAMAPPPAVEARSANETRAEQYVKPADVAEAMADGEGNADLIAWAPDKYRDPQAAIAVSRKEFEAAGWTWNAAQKQLEKDGWYAWYRSQGEGSPPILQWGRIEERAKVEPTAADKARSKRRAEKMSTPEGKATTLRQGVADLQEHIAAAEAAGDTETARELTKALASLKGEAAKAEQAAPAQSPQATANEAKGLTPEGEPLSIAARTEAPPETAGITAKQWSAASKKQAGEWLEQAGQLKKYATEPWGTLPQEVRDALAGKRAQTATNYPWAEAAKLESAYRDATQQVKELGGGAGKLGITPDSVKNSPEYREAKQGLDAADAALKAFNQKWAEVYAKIPQAERMARRQQAPPPGETAKPSDAENKVEAVQKQLASLLGESKVTIVGSHARGTARPDSDYDVVLGSLDTRNPELTLPSGAERIAMEAALERLKGMQQRGLIENVRWDESQRGVQFRVDGKDVHLVPQQSTALRAEMFDSSPRKAGAPPAKPEAQESKQSDTAAAQQGTQPAANESLREPMTPENAPRLVKAQLHEAFPHATEDNLNALLALWDLRATKAGITLGELLMRRQVQGKFFNSLADFRAFAKRARAGRQGDDVLYQPASPDIDRWVKELGSVSRGIIDYSNDGADIKLLYIDDPVTGSQAAMNVKDATSKEAIEAKLAEFRKDFYKVKDGKTGTLYQTGSDYFKRWFGKSKVVYDRAPGKAPIPLPVYHGTRADFTEFKVGDGAAGPGIYFAVNPDKANAFAGFIEGRATGSTPKAGDGGNVIKAFLRIENPLVVKSWDDMSRLKELNEYAREHGYDGMYLPWVGEYVAFSPEQVKSAIGNRGTYDPTSPNILYQDIGDMWMSKAVQVAEAKLGPKGAGEQILATLRNNGVKEAEIKWTGLDDFLASKKSFTKQEVLDYLHANRVAVDETLKGEPYAPVTDAERERYFDLLDKKQGTGRLTKAEDAEYESLGRKLNAEPGDSPNPTRWDKHNGETLVTPGPREGYHELLLQMPRQIAKPLTELPANMRIVPAEEVRGKGRSGDPNELPPEPWILTDETGIWLNGGKTPEEVRTKALKHLNEMAQSHSDLARFTGSHWAEPNVFAHVRFSDRRDAEGKRVLFLEELQSDWAREGRKRGYQNSAEEKQRQARRKELEAQLPPLQQRMTELADEIRNVKPDESLRVEQVADYGQSKEYKVYDRDGNEVAWGTYVDADHALRSATDRLTGNLHRQLVDLDQQRMRIESEIGKLTGGVPDFPFKDNWTEVAMRRMLRYASEHGYDKIAVITGAMTQERYNLSKQVDYVSYHPAPDGRYEVVAGKGSEEIKLGTLNEKELGDKVGKDVAERIVNGIGTDSPSQSYRGWKMLSGVDLRIGGEWAVNHYDRTIPNFLRSYGKKWGAKLGETTLATEQGPLQQEYVGPDKSLAEMQALEQSAGSVLRGQIGSVVDDMARGIPFKDAMSANSSESLAKLVGGKLQMSREQQHIAVPSIDVNDAMRQSVRSQYLFQGDEGKNGATLFLEDGRAIIAGFGAGDVSTLVHETAHIFRRDLDPTELKAAEAAFGVRDGKWTVADDENLARRFERWLHDGDTKGLPAKVARVFEQFRDWLRGVYQRLIGSPIEGRLTTEQKAFFENMLGLDSLRQSETRTASKPVGKQPTAKDESAAPTTPAVAAVDVRAGETTSRNGLILPAGFAGEGNSSSKGAATPQTPASASKSGTLREPPKLESPRKGGYEGGPVILGEQPSKAAAVQQGRETAIYTPRDRQQALDALRKALGKGEEKSRILFQTGKRVRPEDSFELPGFEGADSGRKDALAAAEGERLSHELLKPKDNISGRAGQMEREAPLFRDSEANPQPGLFSPPPPIENKGGADLLFQRGWDSGLDRHLLQLGGYHYEAGAHDFRAWREALASDLGDIAGAVPESKYQEIYRGLKDHAIERGRQMLLNVRDDNQRVQVSRSLRTFEQMGLPLEPKAQRGQTKQSLLVPPPDVAKATGKSGLWLPESWDEATPAGGNRDIQSNPANARGSAPDAAAQPENGGRVGRSAEGRPVGGRTGAHAEPGRGVSVPADGGGRGQAAGVSANPEAGVKPAAERRPGTPAAAQAPGAQTVGIKTQPPIPLAAPKRARGVPLYTAESWSKRLKDMGMPAEAPVPTRELREDIKAKLLPGQPEVAAYLLSGIDQHDAVVLASSTGSGKSYLLSALLANDQPKRAIMLTKNGKLVNDLIKVAKEHYGIEIKKLPSDWEGEIPEGHYITTYGTLRGNLDRIAKQRWDWGLFDESAEARNWQHSDQGAAVKELNDSVGKVIYSSATPFHIPTELGYMTKLGLWDGTTFEKWGFPLGIRREATMNGGSVLVSGPAPRKMEKLRRQLIERGQFISLDKDMKGFAAHFGVVPMTPEVQQGINNAVRAFTLAAEWYSRTPGKGGKVRAAVANQATFVKNYIERMRLPQAIQIAKEAEAKGWKVIFFTENKKEVLDIYDFLHDANEGTKGAIRRLMPQLPGVWETLSKEFGDNLANFSGGHSAAREAELQDFLSGRKQHIFATYGAGGVGVSLHDTVGDAPRFAVYLGLPWSGVMFDQAIGRPWRFGTKSDVNALFLASNAPSEMKLLVGRIGQRLTSLRAAVSGVASMNDPVVQSLHSLDGAIDYSHGGGFKTAHPDEWRVPAREGAVQNWDKVVIPDGKSAIGPDKGIKLPYSDTELAPAGSQFDISNPSAKDKGPDILYQTGDTGSKARELGKQFAAGIRKPALTPPPRVEAAARVADNKPPKPPEPPNGDGGSKPPSAPPPPPESPRAPQDGSTSIQRLTERIAQRTTPETSLADKLKELPDKIIEAPGKAVAEAKSTTTTAVAKLKAASAAWVDNYRRPPSDTDYDKATGRWSGADNMSAWHLHEFAKTILEKHPELDRQIAMTNYIEADGDLTTLAQRAKASRAKAETEKYAQGYEDAMKLTPDEIATAKDVIQHNRETLDEAIAMGMLKGGVEDYIQHVYKNAPQVLAKLRAEQAFTSLIKNPSFTKKRTIPTYFDAEQMGFEPANKAVGFLVSAHERSFRQSAAARAYVRELIEAKASDGKPLIVPSWAKAEALPADERGRSALMIRTNLHPGEEYYGYVRIEHPALSNWDFVTRAADGSPVYARTDVLVHPEIARKLKNNLSKSALRSYEVTVGGHTFKPGAAALNASTELKHAILSFSAFHQTTLAAHALEHRVNPFTLPNLDFKDQEQRFLVDHGMMVTDYDGYQMFDEGVASGGVIGKVPILGSLYRHYTEYLFKSYLPRVKMAMAKEALRRNRERYGKELSEDQIGFLSAQQANAAFGGLNYRMLGRDKTFQDAMRLVFMAPDFFEARARFVGQAAKPYGREQLVALVGGALAMYTAGRLLNMLTDDDPHFDKPFALVYNGKDYALRTVQEDAFNFVRDPGRFFYNRLSPLAGFGIEVATGHDRYGRRQGLLDMAKSSPEHLVPMPAQPIFSGLKLTTDEMIAESILKMVGINIRSDKPRANQNGWLTPQRQQRRPRGPLDAASSTGITLEPPPRL